METLDKAPMEDKIIMSREEEYPPVRELTPGEIDAIVRKALRNLDEDIAEGTGEEYLTHICTDVAYNVMNQMIE
jgi:hypothetical protein